MGAKKGLMFTLFNDIPLFAFTFSDLCSRKEQEKKYDKNPRNHQTDIARTFRHRSDILLDSMPALQAWETRFLKKVSKLEFFELWLGLVVTGFLAKYCFLPFCAFDRKFMCYVRDYIDRGFDPSYEGFISVTNIVTSV